MRTSTRTAILFMLTSVFATYAWAADTKLFCREVSTTIANFVPGTLPFADGTNITDQFKRQGLIFSAEDSDLPPAFQHSLGAQENFIQVGTFFNLFRLRFTSAIPVVTVTVTFGDQNIHPQTHTLGAFDVDGNLVDTVTFTEDGLFPDRFSLTVSSCAGIAFIVAVEQPFGAERFERITFTTGRKQDRGHD